MPTWRQTRICWALEQVFKAKYRGEDVAVKVFVITDQDRSEVRLLPAAKAHNVLQTALL
jgi:hypothetical protein